MKKPSNLQPLDANQRYTVEESIAYLRTSKARIYEKIRAGELISLKDGRRRYIPGTALIAASRGS